MTDILFRAKSYSDGKWITSPTIIQTNALMVHMPVPGEECEFMYDLCSNGPGDIISIPRCRFCRVHPDTICRYTGMKRESDGLMIWENDIIKHTDIVGGVGRISYGVVKHGTFQSEKSGHDDTINMGFYVQWPTENPLRNELYFWTNYEKFTFRNKVEIIGSIHDHPEIMEELKA